MITTPLQQRSNVWATSFLSFTIVARKLAILKSRLSCVSRQILERQQRTGEVWAFKKKRSVLPEVRYKERQEKRKLQKPAEKKTREKITKACVSAVEQVNEALQSQVKKPWEDPHDPASPGILNVHWTSCPADGITDPNSLFPNVPYPPSTQKKAHREERTFRRNFALTVQKVLASFYGKEIPLSRGWLFTEPVRAAKFVFNVGLSVVLDCPLPPNPIPLSPFLPSIVLQDLLDLSCPYRMDLAVALSQMKRCMPLLPTAQVKKAKDSHRKIVTGNPPPPTS